MSASFNPGARFRRMNHNNPGWQYWFVDDHARPLMSRVVWTEQLARQFPVIIPDLVAALTSENALGDQLVDLLGRLGEDHPEVIELLVPLFDHESSAVRDDALQACVRTGGMPIEALPRLIGALQENEDSGQLQSALEDMVALHPREAIAVLMDKLGVDGLRLLFNVDTIYQPIAKILVEELTLFLYSPVAEIRRKAARALAAQCSAATSTGAIHALPRLRELLDDEDAKVRDAARSAIHEMERRNRLPG